MMPKPHNILSTVPLGTSHFSVLNLKITFFSMSPSSASQNIFAFTQTDPRSPVSTNHTLIHQFPFYLSSKTYSELLFKPVVTGLPTVNHRDGGSKTIRRTQVFQEIDFDSPWTTSFQVQKTLNCSTEPGQGSKTTNYPRTWPTSQFYHSSPNISMSMDS